MQLKTVVEQVLKESSLARDNDRYLCYKVIDFCKKNPDLFNILDPNYEVDVIKRYRRWYNQYGLYMPSKRVWVKRMRHSTSYMANFSLKYGSEQLTKALRKLNKINK